jgi:hypothetical protein
MTPFSSVRMMATSCSSSISVASIFSASRTPPSARLGALCTLSSMT